MRPVRPPLSGCRVDRQKSQHVGAVYGLQVGAASAARCAARAPARRCPATPLLCDLGDVVHLADVVRRVGIRILESGAYGALAGRVFDRSPIEKRAENVCVGGDASDLDLAGREAIFTGSLNSYAAHDIVAGNKIVLEKLQSISRIGRPSRNCEDSQEQ